MNSLIAPINIHASITFYNQMRLPYPWQPKIVSTQVAVIGNFVIAGVPGEFTTMSGRRMREAMKSAMNYVGQPESDVVVAGLCNTYSDYITTPEEYQVNSIDLYFCCNLETFFTLEFFLNFRFNDTRALRRSTDHTRWPFIWNNIASFWFLPSRSVNRRSSNCWKNNNHLTSKWFVTLNYLQEINLGPGPSPPNMLSENLITLQTPVIYDGSKWGRSFGDCIRQPPGSARPGDIVSARFVSIIFFRSVSFFISFFAS